MFTAVRVRPAAIIFLLLTASLPPSSGSAASNKPKDFGTSQTPTHLLHGAAALAGIQSTAAIITNISVCSAAYDQMPPVSIPDGGGGSILAWADYRSGNLDIYAQKVDASGNMMWPIDGVPVCKQTGDQTNPRLLADGAGGAFIVWEDARVSLTDVNIYIQRISAQGVPLWGAGGLAVCTAAGNQRQPVLSPNGLGGVLVAWTDERASAASADIYVQRYTAAGAPQWAANGVAMCTATGIQQDPTVVTDGQGGAVAAWRDARGADADVYAQRVNEQGIAQWTVNGVVVSTAVNDQTSPRAIADGSGGVIIAWTDQRGADQDVYAQRLTNVGAALWAANGVAVCATTGNQKNARLCSDGSGGAIVVWEDGRGANADIYAQRLAAANGATQWLPATGLAVCTAATDQLAPAIALDPTGGAVVAWSDARNSTGTDIYSQRLQLGGTVLWTANGVRLCDANGNQDQPAVIADGNGGASVSWRDYRNSAYSDLYAQRVDATGQIPDQCVPPDTLSSNVPISTVATQNWRTFDEGWFYWAGVAVRGTSGDWDIEQFDQGSTGLGSYPTCFGLPLAGSYGAGPGADFLIANFNDNHTPPGVFGVRAYRYSGTGGATIEWDSGPDQLPVGTPFVQNGWAGLLDVYDIPLTAGITYTFDFSHSAGSDMKCLLFTSYNAPGGGYYYVAPRSARVMETPGRYGTYTAPSTEYYGVAIVNDNGVSGDYSLTVRTGVTGVGDPEPAATRLMSLSPNPGRGPVEIRFSMRQPGNVSFQIFDMAGRAVAKIPETRWQQGTWSAHWDGLDAHGHPASAGIYFVQMNVNDQRIGLGRLALVH